MLVDVLLGTVTHVNHPPVARTLRQDAPQAAPFDPDLTEYRSDVQGAVEWLTHERTGEAVGALHHPDIGEIDLVWDEEGIGHHDGYGLAKLVKHHPEMLGDLQGFSRA